MTVKERRKKKKEEEEKKSMIIVVPSCLKDADGARTRSDQNIFSIVQLIFLNSHEAASALYKYSDIIKELMSL